MEGLTLLSFSDPLFWLFLLYFWISISLAWYIPGSVFLKNLKIPVVPHTTLSFLVGLVAWSWQGWIFGYLDMRWASYCYILVFVTLYLIQRKKTQRSDRKRGIGFHAITILLIGLGVVLQQTYVWHTAVRTDTGLSFCCTLPINPVGQLALTNEIIRKIPPDQPGLSGQRLTNYHHWLNIAVAELVRVFRLPLLYTSSHYIPLFTSIFLGLSAITMSSLLGLSLPFVHWFLFFLYFGSDFGFVVPLAFGKGINFLVPSLLNGFTYLFNPQTAISIVLLFCAYALLLLFLKKSTPQIVFLTALLFGSLIGFKVHTGIFALVGLGALAAYQVLRKRYTTILVFTISLFVALIVYLPTNAGAGGIYFSGFWRIEEFMKYPELGFNPSLLARIAYLTKHKQLLFVPFGIQVRVLLYEMLFLLLFLFSLIGTKIVGIFQSERAFGRVPLPIHIFLGSSIVAGLTLGMFFLQTTGVGHSEYFLHAAVIVLSFYAALAVYHGERRSLVLNIVLVVVITGGLLRYYQLSADAIAVMREPTNHYVIFNEELEALSFLRSHTPYDAVVVVDPSNRLDSVVSYVSFMANRPTYLSGKWGLGALNVRHTNRVSVVDRIFGEKNRDLQKLLPSTGIRYVYLTSAPKTYKNLLQQLRVVFSNSQVTILEAPNAL